MRQQEKYRIPASITLAQGLLESGAGRSRLATEANNHFGIKTPGGWTGPYILVDDDRPKERFRKYRSVEESYEDHSLFLKKPRYSRLFTYKITDYKAWAKGLKACGYATSPVYAQSLIRIIEMYSLHQFDTRKPSKQQDISEPHSAFNARGQEGRISKAYLRRLAHNKVKAKKIPPFFRTHTVYHNNSNYFIVVQSGDDLAGISSQTGLSIKELLDYNDLDLSYTLTVGDILYMRDKRKKASKETEPLHVVQPGQSMYDIAQMYGIRLKNLYKLNDLSPRTYEIKVGDTIWVR